jgi:hypothetical protein
MINLRCKNPEPPMSGMGQKQTLDRRPLMSAIHPKADIEGCAPNVRFVPKADIVLLDSTIWAVRCDHGVMRNLK